MKKSNEQFKKLLQDELKNLEEELKTVGRINPDNPSDWEPVPENMDIDSADDNELADKIEHFEGNSGILKQLETQFNEVKSALLKIDKGTYGICEACGGKIEEAKLIANPAAKLCKKDSVSTKVI